MRQGLAETSWRRGRLCLQNFLPRIESKLRIFILNQRDRIATFIVDTKWVVLGSETLFFVGYVCYRTRDLWQLPLYWATFGGALGAHCIGVLLLSRIVPPCPGSTMGF